MAKYIFETEDKEEFIRIVNADSFYSAISDYTKELRSIWKYSEDRVAVKHANKWSKLLYNTLENRNVSID